MRRVFTLPLSTMAAGLRGLDPAASYDVTFSEAYDMKQRCVMTGAALANMRVEINSAPGVMLIRYPKSRCFPVRRKTP